MTKKNPFSTQQLPTKKQTETFDMLQPMLQSFLSEVRELAKKKPDGLLNEVKIKMINRVLKQIKEALETDASIEYLDLLDEETLAQNSDALLILGQYNAAMGQFKEKHHKQDAVSYKRRWFTQED